MVNMNMGVEKQPVSFFFFFVTVLCRFNKNPFESAFHRDAASRLLVIQTLSVGLLRVCLCEAINRCSIMRFSLYFLEKVYFCIAIHIQNDINDTNITH